MMPFRRRFNSRLTTPTSAKSSQKHSRHKQKQLYIVGLFLLGIIAPDAIQQFIMPRRAVAWTTSTDVTGWFGDPNVPAGKPNNNDFPQFSSTGNFSSVGRMFGGSGLTLSNVTLGACCSVFKSQNVSANSYATALTNNEYIYSSLTVSSSSPSVRISAYRFNQPANGGSSYNSSGSQMVLALYDAASNTVTQISAATTLNGTTSGKVVPITAQLVLIPGQTYELRQYFYSSSGSNIANYYVDNPVFQVQVNQAPTAASDSFSTQSPSSVTFTPLSNDTDPEIDTLTITQINGTNITSGGSASVTGGTVTLNADKSLTYQPNAGYSGSPTFQYTISDGNNNTVIGNISGTVTFINLTVTKSTSTTNAVPGGAASYSITVANSSTSSTATNVQISDALPSGFTYDATFGITTSGGASRTSTENPTQGTATPTWGTFSIPASGSVTLNFAANISETNSTGTYQNPVSVTYSTGSASYDPNSSTGEDVTLSILTLPTPPAAPAAPASLGGVCAIPGNDGPAPSTLTGVINTYYPAASATASSGSTSVTVGTATGAAKPIATGDLLLVIQMQDATISVSDSASYGSGDPNNLGSGQTSMGNSGLYEYVVATNSVPLGGGTLTFKGANGGGLSNTYNNAAAAGSRGRRTFQVVRVPQYASLSIQSTLSAGGWDGQTGGIVALDVAGDLNFNGRTIDTFSRGFRAGYTSKNISGNSTTTYVALNATNVNGISGGKGEGTAGTPQLVWNGATAIDNGSDGYPDGDLGKGAPANAGGGGNAHNAGGGGAGNGGIGGQGGLPWNGAGGIIDAGGRPGFFSSTVAPVVWRLTLGGGGGGGDANNAITGVRGGVGSGLTIIRAGRMLGSATILANGDDGDVGVFSGAPDGAGGGGAGGTVLLAARSASPTANITVQANGGKGGNTLNDAGNEHGPGGGGGGGVVLYNVPSGVVSAIISGGANGKSNGGAGIPHGAIAGAVGKSGSFTNLDDPFAEVNGSNCFPALTVTKTTSTPTTKAGQTATYTIAVSNAAGKSDASGVTVTDNLPTGFTYGATSAINLTSGATQPTIANPTSGAAAPTWGDFTIPGGGQVQVIFNVNIGSSVANGTYQNPATAAYPDPTRAVANQTATASYDSASSTGEDVIITSPAKVLLVKRITAINGNRTQNPNDTTALNTFVDDTTSIYQTEDNNAGWPPGYLLGALDAGQVKPGDDIEYTVYFLNAGGSTADTVKICDLVAGAQDFKPDAYGTNQDIELKIGKTTNASTFLTRVNDVGDRAQVITSTGSVPASCNLKAANTNSTVVLDVTGTTGAPALTTLHNTTGTGAPDDSFGFFRFTTKVKP